MKRILITDSNAEVMPGLDFTMREFYHPKFDYTQGPYDLPMCLPLAAQTIRDFFTDYYKKEIPFRVTSTIRTGTDAFTRHQDCLDIIPMVNTWEIMQMIQHEFQNWKESKLVHDLLETGTNVLLYENGCIHLAWRDFKLNAHPEYVTENKEVRGKFYIGFWAPNGTPTGKNICYA